MACWNLPSGRLDFCKFSLMHEYLPRSALSRCFCFFFFPNHSKSGIWAGSLAPLVLPPILKSVCLLLGIQVGGPPRSCNSHKGAFVCGWMSVLCNNVHSLHTFCRKSILPILLTLHLSLRVALAMTHKQIRWTPYPSKTFKGPYTFLSALLLFSFSLRKGMAHIACLLSASWNIKTCGVGVETALTFIQRNR